MSLGTRIADTLNKAVVTGLIGYTGFLLYQIGTNVYEHQTTLNSPPEESKYFEDVKAKIIEQQENDARVDGADAYRDENYVKKQVQASQSFQKK